MAWLLRDLGSKNGVRLDGARRPMVVLVPGAEISVGGVTLIDRPFDQGPNWTGMRAGDVVLIPNR